MVMVFKCENCGIHPKALAIQSLKNDPGKISILCKNYLPDKITIKHQLGERLDGDDEILEELICGKCGLTAQEERMPRFILETMGIIPEKEE